MAASDMQARVDRLVNWLRERSAGAGAMGGIFGVSGGVDSALALALSKLAWPEDCLGLIMPCHSLPGDAADAMDLLTTFHCPHATIDLTDTYDTLLKSLPESDLGSLSLAKANLKPRLRMLTVYYHANLMNYLVVGTGNRDEIYVGYSTKYGDGGVDVLPLGNLTKGEVREMARYLGVPERIVGKPPSAGLWEGQTDEGEMGLLYKDIDAYLLGGKVSDEVKEKIERRHRASEHKRSLPPIPELK